MTFRLLTTLPGKPYHNTNMGVFNRHQPNDVLFLQPVRYAGEKVRRGKVRMLYADASGKVYASIMSRSVYDMARDHAARMKRSGKDFAIVGLETIPGRFIPAAVEVRSNEIWAMQRILEHALKSGRLPDILKNYIKPIIKRSEGTREAIIAEKKKRRKPETPVNARVLERLPYYPEHDIEISMPIYKAEYAYPLILLKRLPADEQTPADTQRLLILDSDGDLAVIKVPTRLVRRIEIELAERSGINRQFTTVLISREDGALSLTLMPLSRLQKRGLDAIIRYFEATGSSKQPVSLAVKKVLSLARERVTPSGQ
jgi:hypothetical protein